MYSVTMIFLLLSAALACTKAAATNCASNTGTLTDKLVDTLVSHLIRRRLLWNRCVQRAGLDILTFGKLGQLVDPDHTPTPIRLLFRYRYGMLQRLGDASIVNRRYNVCRARVACQSSSWTGAGKFLSDDLHEKAEHVFVHEQRCTLQDTHEALALAPDYFNKSGRCSVRYSAKGPVREEDFDRLSSLVQCSVSGCFYWVTEAQQAALTKIAMIASDSLLTEALEAEDVVRDLESYLAVARYEDNEMRKKQRPRAFRKYVQAKTKDSEMKKKQWPKASDRHAKSERKKSRGTDELQRGRGHT